MYMYAPFSIPELKPFFLMLYMYAVRSQCPIHCIYMYIPLSFQAGSSSPVSSISGFSTNSHLDDGAEDNTQSSSSLAATSSITSGGGGVGGGARDEKKNDPFGMTGSAAGSDLFSAFSVPTSSSSDPFFSSGGSNLFAGKPSDVSAFDPFGISDPFKVSE